MNLFSLGFKSDKDLHKYLNYGKIDKNPIQINQKAERKSTYTNSQLDNLIDNNEKISMGIRDSNLRQNLFQDDRQEKEEEKNIEKVEEDIHKKKMMRKMKKRKK